MTTVSADIEFTLAEDTATSIPARLQYDATQPYAVRAVFCTHEGDVTWELGRELLAAGLHANSGLGDVNLRPARRGLRATVVLTLTSPSGQVALESDRAAIQAFLAQTYQLVAAGAEAARLDLDAALAQLLSQGQNPR